MANAPPIDVANLATLRDAIRADATAASTDPASSGRYHGVSSSRLLPSISSVTR